MIVLDANILVYAYSSEAPEYLEKIFAAPEPIGLPPQSVAAFLRVMTHAKARRPRVALAAAVEAATDWLSLPPVRLLVPGDRHWTIFSHVLLEGRAEGRLVTDAQIAAVTVESGGELQSNDRDFARFPGLRWRNPLKG